MAGNNKSLQQEQNHQGCTQKAGHLHNENIKFKILVRGRNCQDYLGKCIRSLYKQTADWEALVSLDAPKDESAKVLLNFVNTKINGVVHDTHLGLCKNMWLSMNLINAQDEDVICIVDADDKLTHNALTIVENIYKKYPDTLATYGSYLKLSKGNRTKISQPYPNGCDFRKYPWRGSHLKTFKYKLWKHIKKDYFKNGNDWLQAASDLALMIPILELAGHKRIKHIHEFTYIWRDNTKYKTNVKLQKQCEEIIRNKQRLNPIE